MGGALSIILFNRCFTIKKKDTELFEIGTDDDNDDENADEDLYQNLVDIVDKEKDKRDSVTIEIITYSILC